jgi:hypothetical protein
MASKLGFEAVRRLCGGCESLVPGVAYPLTEGAQESHKVSKGRADNLMANDVPTSRDEFRREDP